METHEARAYDSQVNHRFPNFLPFPLRSPAPSGILNESPHAKVEARRLRPSPANVTVRLVTVERSLIS
jgi:hypothetical protein